MLELSGIVCAARAPPVGRVVEGRNNAPQVVGREKLNRNFVVEHRLLVGSGELGDARLG
jgi:hypothetical protein